MSVYCPVDHGVRPIADDIEAFASLDGIQVIEKCLGDFPDSLTATLTNGATTHGFIRYGTGGDATFDQSRNRFDLLIEWLTFNHRGDIAAEIRREYSTLHQAVFSWEVEAKRILSTTDPAKLDAEGYRGNVEWLLGLEMHAAFGEIQYEASELVKYLRHLELALTAATTDIIDTDTARKMLGLRRSDQPKFNRWMRNAGISQANGERGKWFRDEIERFKAENETSDN